MSALFLGIAMAAAPLAAAQPAAVARVQGDYGKVTWSARTGTSTLLGYVYTARQARGGVYVYYAIQRSGMAPVLGYGTVPNGWLTTRRNGDLHLEVDLAKASTLSVIGPRTGKISIVWKSAGSSSTVQKGIAASELGGLTEGVTGTWSSAPASASGAVIEWAVAPQQRAEMGTTAAKIRFDSPVD